MPDLIQIGSPSPPCSTTARASKPLARAAVHLQAVTLAWMLVECGASLYAAAAAHSPALLAFGADSGVELLSATVVLLQILPGRSLSERKAARVAGALLFVLAFVVAAAASCSLIFHAQPETTRLGIGISVGALVAMPILATLKRREARRSGNAAMAADSVQSATCAYLALLTLLGLAMNAAFHLPWIDSAAALAAIPLLIREGWSAWRGQACGCC